MPEQVIIFGIALPSVIFIASFLVTYLLYRKFSRELLESGTKAEKNDAEPKA